MPGRGPDGAAAVLLPGGALLGGAEGTLGFGVSFSLIFLSGRAGLGGFSWGPGRDGELSPLSSSRSTWPSTRFRFAQISSYSMNVPQILFF